jgi:hypothetical protein
MYKIILRRGSTAPTRLRRGSVASERLRNTALEYEPESQPLSGVWCNVVDWS